MDIALDCETGGLDAELNPLLGFDLWTPSLEKEGKTLTIRVKGTGQINRFGVPLVIHPRALQANGLDPEQGDTPAAARDKLVRWWESIGSPQLHLVGHNVGPFDVSFLKQLTWHHKDLPWQSMFDYHYQDTASLAYALQKAGLLHFGKWSLTNVCQVLGILYDPHISRADAKASWYANERMLMVMRCSFGQECGMQGDHTIRDHLPALDLRG